MSSSRLLNMQVVPLCISLIAMIEGGSSMRLNVGRVVVDRARKQARQNKMRKDRDGFGNATANGMHNRASAREFSRPSSGNLSFSKRRSLRTFQNQSSFDALTRFQAGVTSARTVINERYRGWVVAVSNQANSLGFTGFIWQTIGILFTSFAAVLAICGCTRCVQCRLRDFPCVKSLLLWIGHDEYNDFELVVVTHQLLFEVAPKIELAVRVSGGSSEVMSEYSKKFIFQQPLVLSVEQGTEEVTIDIIDRGRRVVATLSLDVGDDILEPEKPLRPEAIYRFKAKNILVKEPRAQLSIHVNTDTDEYGILEGFGSETDILVRQHLMKARNHVTNSAHLSFNLDNHDGAEMAEIEVLKESCTGPLERMFGLGSYETKYVGIIGPPTSRHWFFCFWRSKEAFEEHKECTDQLDLLKVRSVQSDPSRHHVFVISYVDEKKRPHTMTFRRIDRNRDVWVTCLQRLIQKAHAWKEKEVTARKSFRQVQSF